MKDLKDLLTLPGNGVFTVHTAREKKEKLFSAYYGTKDLEKAKAKWQKTFSLFSEKLPFIFGIPSDTGGGIQRGANWGPLALRQELLSEKKTYQDLGDVRVIPHLLHDKYLNPATIKLCQKALYGKVNKLPVAPLSMAEKALDEVYKKFPQAHILGLGGDHSTSYPLVASWLKSRKNLKEAAVLHFDAHTDLLEHRLGIDLCFGTWTFQILKKLQSRDHIVQVGIRSSGKDKKHWEKKVGVRQIWAKEFAAQGVEGVHKKVKTHFQKLGVKEIYCSFDIDALDVRYAAATGTPEGGGLLPTDCVALMHLLRKDFIISGADLMEVAPFVWPEGVEARDQQASLSVAGDVARHLLTLLR